MAIPLTRLGGGSAFNHSPGDAEAEYDRLRDDARAEAQKRNDCFNRSKRAYESGDGQAAKDLSNEGKKHAALMDEYNRRASEYIFRENNAAGRVAADTIDLHGQFVEEAEEILDKRIRYAQQQGQTHLHVIVGKGNHSANHVQKLKPSVEKVCRELGLQYSTEDNAGRIYVNLQGGEAVPPPDQDPYDPHHAGGGGATGHHQQGQQHHGGGGHHQQQQQHHHQQQQQQEGDVIEKLISKAMRKLGDCCVVM
ncbi:putative smr domain-containing protein [Eutypa lata UCREL1]|uniref:Putative smr domain-containing protein n=1 Tax=Eutypa lata (strain UCR-EL1) TaxID=1287681 RepID=M7SN16_EUTLA|nr:putative smr domain-containing protein [Eutypa lata UCREL1]